MSDDIRAEAAGIARALRRTIERERALGLGELLASGVAKAGPDAHVVVPVRGFAPASPVQAPEPFTLTPPPADLDKPARAAAAVAVAERAAASPVELPPFTDDLFPSALAGGREHLVATSLPVLDAVASEARACQRCGLCTTRTNAVPGVGSARSGIVFVGEAPGADEDARGEPFVGRAGELLTKMIAGMDDRKLIPGVALSRESVYIVNVLKCRPPENRNPLPHEVEACTPFLVRQLEALQPRIICCLGRIAADFLIGVKGSLSSLRGRTFRWRGAKLVVTYHPAYLLRNPSAKVQVWEDLQRLAQEYLTD